MQNRLSFTMSNLTSQAQNIEASRSSIEDVDFAADATDLADTSPISYGYAGSSQCHITEHTLVNRSLIQIYQLLLQEAQTHVPFWKKMVGLA